MFHFFSKRHRLEKKNSSDRRGVILVYLLIFGSLVTTMLVTGLASYTLFEHRVSMRKHDRDLAFHIAEAGINYYRWHLAHYPDDLQNGTGQPGPYELPFRDKDGNTLGYYSLDITQPLIGSTIVQIRSTGWTTEEPDRPRTLVVRLGFPALADYTFLQNANMRFSSTTVVHGPVHSNGGIQFDGTTDAEVTSARQTYDPGDGIQHPGVWGVGGPTNFFTYPVPAQDFNAVTVDLANLQADAISGGTRLLSSGREGWHITFRTDGRYDLRRVNSRSSYDGNAYDINGQTFWGTYDPPANGALFVEDNVWVDGIVDGRITVGASNFQGAPDRDIIISGNLMYETQVGDDVLGLIAERDIVVPRNVPDTMTINAAALAQNGRIFRPYYTGTNSIRTNLVFSGSQIAFSGGGWKYLGGSGTVISGFVNTNHSYDGNLRFYPPPGFPTSGVYELLSWAEEE